MDLITKQISRTTCFLCVILITGYQYLLSPLFKLLGVNCRFDQSCSAYAKAAFKEHGFFRALYLSIKRLVCCNPYFHNTHQ